MTDRSGVFVPVYRAGRVVAWSVVDEADVDRVMELRWYCDRAYGGATAHDPRDKSTVGLHRFVMGLRKGDARVVHHISEGRLDNRKANLQIVADASVHGRMPHFFRDMVATKQLYLPSVAA